MGFTVRGGFQTRGYVPQKRTVGAAPFGDLTYRRGSAHDVHKFALPGAWAEGNRLVVALPKLKPIDLFELPVSWKPTRGRVLLSLSQDIEAVLEMADAVIDLAFRARGRIGGRPRDRTTP